MGIKFSNLASTTLASSVTSSATSLSVADGSVFPSLGAGDYFYATIDAPPSATEIVKVTARSGNTLTVVRAQDNTTATTHASGDSIALRVVSAVLEDIASAAATESVSLSGDTMTGNLAITAASSPTITLTDTTNTAILKVYSQDTESIIGTYSNHNLGLFTNSTRALTIDTSQNASFSGNVTISLPDEGGTPAMTATLNLHGYEGRGAGIKIKDSVNSASSASDREWFVGSGYNQGHFNIGYASDGSQSSYPAQSKLTISTSGTATFAGKIMATAIGTNSSLYALDLSRSGSGSSPDIWSNSNNLVLGTSSSTPVLTLLNSNATFAGNVDATGIFKVGTYAAAQLKVNGYSSTYRSIQIGAPDNNGGSVALAIDVSAFPNTAGNFAGKDSVFIGKNGLIFPNADADNWIGGIARGTSSDVIHVGPATTGGASSGPLTLTSTDATFAGNLDVDGSAGIYQRNSSGGSIVLDDTDTADASTPMVYLRNTAGELTLGRANRNATTGLTTGSTDSLTISSAGAATFAGNVDVSGELDVTGSWSLDGISGNGFKSYTYGTMLDIANLNSGGWARAHKILTSDDTGSVAFGVHGSGTTLTKAYWSITGDGNSDIGYNDDHGIFMLKNGDVGFGVQSPTEAIDVSGNGKFSGTVTSETTTGDATFVAYRNQTTLPNSGDGSNLIGAYLFKSSDSSGSEPHYAGIGGFADQYGRMELQFFTERDHWDSDPRVPTLTLDRNKDATFAGDVTAQALQVSDNITFSGISANAYKGIVPETDQNLMLGTGSGSEPRIYLKGTANGQSDAGDLFLGAGTGGTIILNGPSINCNAGLNVGGSGFGTLTWGTIGSGSAFGIRSGSGKDLSIGSGGSWDVLRLSAAGDATFSGRVGIGNAPVSGVGLRIQEDSTTNVADFRNANASGYGLYVAGGSGSGQYAFRAANNANAALFTVLADGKVGIGASAPGNIVEVAGASPVVEINATSGNPELQFSDGGTDEFSMYYDTGANAFKFVEGGVGTQFSIADGGDATFSGDITFDGGKQIGLERVGGAVATVGPGWMTVATNTSGRRHGEIIVTDADSGDHGFIRIDWMRSYADSNFTVFNTGGHSNRITGCRVLSQDGNNTYGTKIIQVYVAVSSTYEVDIYHHHGTDDYSVHTAVTPVIEDTKTGYSLHGEQLEDLNTYGFAAEEGIRAGGSLAVGGLITVGDSHTIGNDSADNLILTSSADENIVLDSAKSLLLDHNSGSYDSIYLRRAGAIYAYFRNSSDDLLIGPSGEDHDIFFQGNDGGSTINMLKLDASEYGNATFSGHAILGGKITVGTTIDGVGAPAAGTGILGATAAYGAILTGQGTTNDVTISNDLGQSALGVPTGARDVVFSGHIELADSKYVKLGADADFIIYHDGTSNYIQAAKQDSDIIFRGNDGGTNTNFLTLDASEAGKATFTGRIVSNASSNSSLYALALSRSGSGNNPDIWSNNDTLVLGTSSSSSDYNIKMISDATHVAGFLGVNGANGTAWASNNSGKADFSVATGGSTGGTIAIASDEVRIGNTDVNWNAKLSYTGSTYLSAWNNSIAITAYGGTTDREISIWPSDAGTAVRMVTVDPDYVQIGTGSQSISMDGNSSGQLKIAGSGYTGAIALDGTAMHIYHNSSSRSLVLGSNESAGITINGSNQTNFHGTTTWGGTGTISWGSMAGGTGFGMQSGSGRGLSLGSNGTWDYLVIDTSANVGIGVSSSIASKLHVKTGGATELTVEGDSDGYINAGLVLKANGSAGYRGLGVFMHDKLAEKEWYAGTPYASADTYIIARKTGLASHNSNVAQTANQLVSVNSSGTLTVHKGTLQVGGTTGSHGRIEAYGSSGAYIDLTAATSHSTDYDARFIYASNFAQITCKSGHLDLHPQAGATYIRHAGSVVLESHGAGVTIRDTSGADAKLHLGDSSNGDLGYVYANSTNSRFELYSYMHGAKFYFRGKDGDENNHTCFWADPDDETYLYYDGNWKARTRTDGFQINGSLSYNSDRRLKKDITPISGALDAVMSLRGVNYTLIDSDTKHIGFVAQDIQSDAPNWLTERVVVEPDRDDETAKRLGAIQDGESVEMLALNYANMVALLTEAIKEQQTQIENLTKRIAELEA